MTLIDAIARDPLTGIGKPERLRNAVGNVWSRRITQEHRLVYLVAKDRVTLMNARYHY